MSTKAAPSRLLAGVAGGAVIGGLSAAAARRNRKPVATVARAAAAPPAAQQMATTVSLDEVGKATWTLLHTTAAQFPEYPTRRQRKAAMQLFDSLEHVYPCHSCAKHWGEIMKEFGPPKVRSGSELRTWLCEMHNVVNKSAGKSSFNCGDVEERWGGGIIGAAGALCGEGPENACRIPGRR